MLFFLKKIILLRLPENSFANCTYGMAKKKMKFTVPIRVNDKDTSHWTAPHLMWYSQEQRETYQGIAVLIHLITS